MGWFAGRRVFAQLVLLSCGFLVLDLLFWATADFGSFMPPSVGAWQERAFYAGVTAMGPVAMAQMGFDWAWRDGWIATGLIVATTVSAMLWPRTNALRYLAYCAVLCWWVLGFGVAAIRIT